MNQQDTDLRIEYYVTGLGGSITTRADMPAYIWNQIKSLVLGVQPDALIVDNRIDCEWSTILSIIDGIGWIKQNYGLNVTCDTQADAFIRRHIAERRQIREAEGTLTLQLTEVEVTNRLLDLGFTRRELKSHQARDVVRLLAISNGANFSVPGAGKTTVALAVHLLSRDANTHLLVVAPKNAFAAWDEVITDCIDPKTNNADMTPFVRLVGGFKAVRDILLQKPPRMIISYDQLIRCPALVSEFLAMHKCHVILDESHRMKAGYRSERGIALLSMAHLPVRRDILSGTPIPRSIEDIVPQLDFLWPGQAIGQRVSGSSNPHSVLKNLYVRTTKHELGLPPTTRSFEQVEMSRPQLALYGIVREEVLKKLAGIKSNSKIDLMSAKRSVLRLLQVSSNPILMVRRLTNESPLDYNYDDPTIEAIFTAIVEETDSPKIKTACNLARNLAAAGQKSVMWTSFTDNVERLAELLSDLGATYIHGGIDAGDDSDPVTREGRIKRFHDDSDCYVLVANPAACSEGISLHRVCHNAIYVDRTFNAAHYLQSVDRIHRLGLEPDTQTNITVLESIAPGIIGAIDYSVRRRLIDKLRTMSSALDDSDLRELALDEEDGEQPVDYDITLEDVKDLLDELMGKAPEPSEEED